MNVIGSPRAHDIELADLDCDGRLDVVTRQQGEDGKRLELWRRTSRGGWEHQSLACPVGEGLTVDDMDRDGDVDIVIPAHWYETPNGWNGTWEEHSFSSEWVHNACAIKSGDINGDHRVDIVVTPAEKRGGEYRIAWFESPEDPKTSDWTEHVIDHSVETVLHSLGVGDMDADGQLDVVTAEMTQGADPDEVRIYFGSKKGTQWNQQIVANTGSHAIRVVDVGSDGDLDIVGANWNRSSVVDLWENVGHSSAARGELSLDEWTYIEVDNSRDERAFGLAAADMNGDGYSDIASGKYFYRNPGKDMGGRWLRTHFPVAADTLLALDVDGDAFGDVIALDKSGKVYWLEAANREGSDWRAEHVGDVGEADHGISSQGYTIGQLIPGGRPEVVINVGAIYFFELPDRAQDGEWRRTTITQQAYPEGVVVGDIDQDGALDLSGTLDNRKVAWWRNPSDHSSPWTPHVIGSLPDKYAVRFYHQDLNGDGRADIVVCAANGSKNGVYWLEQPIDVTQAWTLHTVGQQATTNSMDVADMDRDGDIDIVSGEHRGEEKVAIWANDGQGRFSEHFVSRGLESHLGTRLFDLDGDGDLDIVSIAWDDYQFLHLWRNDAVSSR